MMDIDADKYWFDEKEAQRAVEFFENYLIHVKGELAGSPFKLAGWQREHIIQPMFGWKHKDTGLRKYRTIYCAVPKKNGKSLLAAGIALFLQHADHEPGAEVYSAAADRDQASIVFDVAKQMVLTNPSLNARTKCYRVSKVMVVEDEGTVYKALSSDAHTKHGYNPHGIIFDELHTQPNRDLWDTLTTGVVARRQPVVFAITTAGYDRNSICYEIHDYACKVRDGIIEDETFLPVIYAAPDDADWTDEQVWRDANPNFEVSVKRDYFVQKVKEAQSSPAKENVFKRLHLNVWTEQSERWLEMPAWNKCGEQKFTAESLHGQECIGGLDLGATADLTALCLLFESKDPPAYKALWWFWCPADNARKRERRDRAPYETWARQKHITLTPGNETDYNQVRSDVNEIAEKYVVKELAVDRLFQGAQLAQQLGDDGFEVVPFGQGFMSMAAPTQEFERVVNRGEFLHGNNPVMKWMASNVAVKMDSAGNLKPDKEKSGEKIDGVVASIMAVGRWMVTERKKPSVYETRGIQHI